ncbi:MAG: DUF1906 domain-containing protein [Catenulispora sp.]|nr:DUF1906 domain-containing protein [Catenulispora sp.]
MSLIGVDIAWDRPTVAAIQGVGAHFVARYLSTDPSKNITAAEVTAYRAAGIGTVVVWETTTGRATAGYAAGQADAQAAEQQRKAVGLPGDMPIHFAVDEDTAWASVAPYFAGASSVIGQARVGVYGGYAVIEGAAAAGYRWLWQTLAWSGGRWSSHATIRQTGGTTLHGGADWDTAETPDYGQYPRPTTPQEIDMTPAEHQMLADIHAALASWNDFKGWDYANRDERKANPHSPDAWGKLGATLANSEEILTAVKAGAPLALTDAQVKALASQVVPVLVPQLVAALGHALDGTKP